LTFESEEKRKVARQKVSRKGGEKVAEERGSEFHREIGWKGGKSREKNR
jgi:hypothetical protein